MKREFRQRTKLGKIRRWVIEVKKNTFSMSDGEVDGKMKEPTIHICESKNVGRSNVVSPEQQAINEAERMVELKTRAGYKEVDPKTGEPLEGSLEMVDEIDFDDPSTSTKHYKPEHGLTRVTKKALKEQYAWMIRKRDGNRTEVVYNSRGSSAMFTSSYQSSHPEDNGLPYFDRFPHLQAALYQTYVPPRSLLLCELVTVATSGFVDKHGFDVDKLLHVDAVRGGKTDHALELQQRMGSLGLCIWDWAWRNGECLLQTKTNAERFDMVKELVDSDESGYLTYPEVATVVEEQDTGEKFIELTSPNLQEPLRLELDNDDFEATMIAFAKEVHWEGWVVVDPNAVLGEEAWNTRGKWQRPSSIAKLKPEYDIDVIAFYDPDNGVGKKGKGKKKVGLGSAECFLYNPKTRQKVPVGSCGNGFTEEDILRLGNPKLYPMVWRVTVTEWTEDGQLWHPRFHSIRDDKTFEECGIDQNRNWESVYA